MNKQTKTIIKAGIGLIVVIGIGFMVKNYVGNKVEKASNIGKTVYMNAPVERIDLETYSRGSGIFASFNTVDIKLEDGQKITKKFINDGDMVQANQNLFLVSNGSESSYIKTSIGGLYFEKHVDNNATTYQVYDTGNTGVTIQVSEENVAKLQVGQVAKVMFSAIDKEINGSVVSISKIAENGNFPVRIQIPYEEALRFGYNASVKIITSSKPQALCIPYNAVYFEGDQSYVIKAKHVKKLNETNKITDDMKTHVKVGVSDNDYVEILEGLSESDQVVLGNMQE